MSAFRSISRAAYAAFVLLCLASCGKEPEAPPAPGEINFLSVDGSPASFDRESLTFTVTLPAVTDFSAVVPTFTVFGDAVYVGDTRLVSGVTQIDASAPVQMVAFNGEASTTYTLKLRNTSLPIVRISTPGGRNVTSKTEWMEGATIRVEYPDGSVDYEGPMSIKGRGNSTWTYPKKPYAIRLDKKDKMLGMPKHKRWVLLANWKDRTLLRNEAAFWISRHTGLPYTVRGQFVELDFNGKHVGNYYLCEQIKIGKNRVDIDEMEPFETDPELITGGYIMEIDPYLEDEKYFISPYFKLTYQFKQPDEDDLSDAAYEYMKSFVSGLEALLKDDGRVQNHEYEEFFDVDSAIWFMFVNELATNTDFYNNWPSDGPHSAYLYKERGGKLYSGPVWDFDFHGFLPDLAHQWAGATKTIYYPALYKDEKFRARMLELWNSKKDELLGLTGYIDDIAEKIRLSEQYNHQLWPIPTYQTENGDEQMTFQEAVDRIKLGFTEKWKWMDAHIGDLR